MPTRNALSVLMLILAVGLVAGVARAEPGQDQVIQHANQLIRQGQHQPAIDHLEKALEQDQTLMESPGFLLAWADAYLGYLPTLPAPDGGDEMQIDKYAGVVEVCRLVLGLVEPESEAADGAKLRLDAAKSGLTRMGAQAMQDRRLEQAARAAQALIDLFPNDALGGTMLYQIGDAMEDNQVRLAGLRAAVTAGPKDPQLYSFAALMEGTPQFGGGAEAAVGHILAGLAVMPDDLFLLHDHANYLIEARRNEDALAALQKFEARARAKVQDQDELVMYIAAAGMLYDRLGQPAEAEAHYQWVLERDPSHFTARFNLATIHINRAAAIQREMNNLPLDAEPAALDALKARADAELQRARPHLEYLDANAEPDSMVLLALSNVYTQLDLVELAQKARDKREKLLNGEPLE